jgi:SAM-dependent methyltransferase
MRLYDELASWWTLLTPPKEYAEEAAFYARVLHQESKGDVRSLLELGSGGGNNASHLKLEFNLTLSDLSAEMLAISRALNPECEHIQGDMRNLRLGRRFDAVFIHDAITYMTTEADLRAALETAFVHCRRGGVALFVPDHVRETFRPMTSHGGYDDANGRRGLRFLEWVWDPDPCDTTCIVDYAYVLREEDGQTRVEHDRAIEGLFSCASWLDLLEGVGFEARAIPAEYAGSELGDMRLFVARRPLPSPGRRQRDDAGP